MVKKLSILGIQFGGHDTAAALMIDGEIVAACEQERYSLEKHCREFPLDAMNDCLKIGGITLDDVDEIAFCSDPIYQMRELYLKPALESNERFAFLIKDFERVKKFFNMEETIREKTGFKKKIRFHNHHLCHVGGAFYSSGFKDALLASYDGIGDKETGLLAIAKEGNLTVVNDENLYPHSVGLLYSAVTHYLGFKHHCDEGIIMGLAPYGNAQEKIPGSTKKYRQVFDEILTETGDYGYQIDTSWIAYHEQRDTWISKKFTDVFGEKRTPDSELNEHHKNIAAALQKRLEALVINQLKRARKEFGLNQLVLSGGVALNCSMNGKVENSGIFDEIFVQPASGDSGTVIGACYLSMKELGKLPEIKKRYNYYLGSSATENEIQSALENSGLEYKKAENIFEETAKRLAAGKIIGWFQGGAEFGPRALGNRSILTKPFPGEMRDYLNKKVKFREEFRPFAPAILAEHLHEYFTLGQESPHMLIACKVKTEKKGNIAATVHVDDSCRVQSVKEENNPRFRKLLEAFHKETGCPVLLNTSFNVKGQPIVNIPQHAIDCFKNTNINFLVIGDYYTEKSN